MTNRVNEVEGFTIEELMDHNSRPQPNFQNVMIYIDNMSLGNKFTKSNVREYFDKENVDNAMKVISDLTFAKFLKRVGGATKLGYYIKIKNIDLKMSSGDIVRAGIRLGSRRKCNPYSRILI